MERGEWRDEGRQVRWRAVAPGVGVCLVAWLLVVGCGPATPLPSPAGEGAATKAVTPTATVVIPPMTPTPTATPTPTPTYKASPTPVVWLPPRSDSGWECDPSGGPACYADLYYVTMLNAREGWAVGSEDMVLHTWLPSSLSE